jgi:NAD(P)-dependent dehydrogenase (short-subunit alcohol dehydrogenase family)
LRRPGFFIIYSAILLRPSAIYYLTATQSLYLVLMSLYRESYRPENVKGPGDGRPTALKIIEDERAGGNLADKVILLTGSSSGIGVETARALAATGATLFLGVRDIDKAKRVHADILSPKVRLLQLDVCRLPSVRKAAEKMLRWSGDRLNILINNAGVLAPPEFHIDQLESQLAVHYWGPFLLFQLLKDTMISSSSPKFPSRVVNVASKGHQTERIDFEDLHLLHKKSVFDGYGRSKLAQVYMASEIERRYGLRGLHGYSLDPGVIREGSAITRHVEDLLKDKWNDPFLQKQMMTQGQGAATTVWAAVSDQALDEQMVGKYLEFCWPAPAAEGANPGMEPGYADWAYDVEDAKRLWDASFELVGLTPED